jgi:hypothetical protein
LDESEAQHQPVWSDLEEIARPARERRRLPPDVRSEIIINLCRRAPLSVKDLSVLLDRSEAYVGDAIRPLVTAGSLTFLYPDQPRHPRQKYIAEDTSAVADPINVDDEEVEIVIEPAIVDEPVLRTPVARPMDRPVAVEARPHRFPNQATNLVTAAVVGIVLGVIGFSLWWVVALVVSLALSGIHVAADSVQFRQFSSLRFLRSQRLGFMLLKTLVTFVEITIVYLLVRVLFGAK